MKAIAPRPHHCSLSSPELRIIGDLGLVILINIRHMHVFMLCGVAPSRLPLVVTWGEGQRGEGSGQVFAALMLASRRFTDLWCGDTLERASLKGAISFLLLHRGGDRLVLLALI